MKTFLSWFFSFFLTVNIANSGVVVVPICPNDYKASDFPFVGSIYNKATQSAGSAVVIGNGQYIITARHVLTMGLEISGNVVQPQDVLYITENKNHAVSEIYASQDADVAILKLTDKLEHFVFLSQYYDFGQEIYGVGVGRGSSKVDFDKIDFDLPYGTKRVFKNQLQGLLMKRFIDDNCIERKFPYFYYMLREKNSLLGEPILGEGMQGPGDSGGGLFCVIDNKIYLFAIMSSVCYERPITGFATDLESQKEWIETIVPQSFAK